jgi:hypothetical protein
MTSGTSSDAEWHPSGVQSWVVDDTPGFDPGAKFWNPLGVVRRG